MTTGNGKQTTTVLDDINAQLAQFTALNFVAPKSAPEPGDRVVGAATEHMKALYTAKHSFDDELKAASTRLKQMRSALVAAMPEHPEPDVSFEMFVEKHPEMAAAFQEADDLRVQLIPKAFIRGIFDRLLKAEVARQFPATTNLDGEDVRITSDWNIVIRKRKRMQDIGDLLAAALGGLTGNAGVKVIRF